MSAPGIPLQRRPSSIALAKCDTEGLPPVVGDANCGAAGQGLT